MLFANLTPRYSTTSPFNSDFFLPTTFPCVVILVTCLSGISESTGDVIVPIDGVNRGGVRESSDGVVPGVLSVSEVPEMLNGLDGCNVREGSAVSDAPEVLYESNTWGFLDEVDRLVILNTSNFRDDWYVWDVSRSLCSLYVFVDLVTICIGGRECIGGGVS